MHAYCLYNFKTALYSSAVVMKGFNSTLKLKAGHLLIVLLLIRPLTL